MYSHFRNENFNLLSVKSMYVLDLQVSYESGMPTFVLFDKDEEKFIGQPATNLCEINSN